MKALVVLIIAALVPFSGFSLSFSKKKAENIKIKTDKGEYTYMDPSQLVVVYDSEGMTAYIGYHKQATKPDATGKYILIFIELKSYEFDTNEQFQAWIQTVKPYKECLTVAGVVDCD